MARKQAPSPSPSPPVLEELTRLQLMLTPEDVRVLELLGATYEVRPSKVALVRFGLRALLGLRVLEGRSGAGSGTSRKGGRGGVGGKGSGKAVTRVA